MIFERESGRYLGSIGIGRIRSEWRSGELGFWIDSLQAGQGYATEAARRVVQFSLDDLKLIRIEIVAAVENQGSRRVIEKIGGQFEGVARNRMFVNGETLDGAVYSIIPESDG